ncbi:nuclear transport factor 2 family protein [Mycobacterium sp. 1164966.3]|uniref:nuclear transport factor 2 family protein n=1 Tax=Mycobacterium sp. 1164966.3 TaxID=1856861 RepID=UPI000B32FC30|nr:nuclear transport factor 2 family protein [Mycobacterium sp. 1164966.3]
MSYSPESLVRKFFAAWEHPKPDELGGFFHDAAEWVDGPQGVRKGADAIKSELTAQLTALGGVRVEVTTLVVDGPTVMVEQVSNATFRGRPITSVVMAVFEFDPDGRIMQWREAYDLKSVMNQIKAVVQADPG